MGRRNRSRIEGRIYSNVEHLKLGPRRHGRRRREAARFRRQVTSGVELKRRLLHRRRPPDLPVL